MSDQEESMIDQEESMSDQQESISDQLSSGKSNTVVCFQKLMRYFTAQTPKQQICSFYHLFLKKTIKSISSSITLIGC